MNMQSNFARRQGGVALVVALILLVVMTLLGLSAMDSVMLETKMATNAQERAYAFQIAETVLAESEQLFDDADAISSLSSQMDRDMGINEYLNDNASAITNVHRDPSNPGRNLLGGIAGQGDSDPDNDIAFMEYRGIFTPVAGVASTSAFSAVATNMAYFELMTVSENVSGNPDAQQFKVRAGYRQLVPQTE
jgi:hypothetical protein